jgi:SAM-dependent methyltransferase
MDRLLRATAAVEARHFWFRGLRAFATPLVRRAAGASGASGVRAEVAPTRILDCGCGTGANLRLLNRFGRAYGFDLSQLGVQFARDAGLRRVARASVAAAPFPSAAFDIVTSFDVLYSLDEDAERRAIAEMYRVLRPGGHAIVNVAAWRALRGDHSVLSHELRRYDRRELRDRLTSAGFVVVRLTYTNAALFLPLLLSRAIQRRRGLRTEDRAAHEIALPPPPINAALSAVVWLESVWLRWFDLPVGSSLLCLARKPDTAIRANPEPDGART